MSADASRPTPVRPGDAAATSGGTAQVPDTGTDKQSGNQQNPRGPRGLDQYLYSSGTSTPTEGFTGMEDRDKRPVSPAVLKFIEQAGPSSGSGGVSTPDGGISGGGKPSGGSADHSGSSSAAGASNGGDTGDKGSPTPTDSAATVPGGTPTAFDSTASQPATAGASLILGAAIPASDSGAESPPTAQPTDSGTVESGGTSNADAVAPTEDKSDGSRAGESTLYSVRVADIGGAAGDGNTVQVSQDGHSYFVGISRTSDNGVTTVTIGTGKQSENATVRLPDSVAGDTKITIREPSSPGKLAEIEVSAGRPVIDATSSNAFDVKLSTPFGPPTPESKIGLAKDSSPSPPALEKTTATKADKVAPPPSDQPGQAESGDTKSVAPTPDDTKHGEGSAKGAATGVKEPAESFRTGLAETGRALEQKVAEVRDVLTKHGIDPNRPQDLLHATPRQQLGVVKDLIEALQVPEASLPEQRARWELHYAEDAAEKAWHDFTNPNNTLLQRAEAFKRLCDMAPAAAVEQGFVKPLLDAPANILEAGELANRMVDHIAAGRLDLAVQDAKAAGSRTREALLAVLSVVPVGMLEGAAVKGEGLAGSVVKGAMKGTEEVVVPAERALGSATQKGASKAAAKGGSAKSTVPGASKAPQPEPMTKPPKTAMAAEKPALQPDTAAKAADSRLSSVELIDRMEAHLARQQGLVDAAIKAKDGAFFRELGFKESRIDRILSHSRAARLERGNAIESAAMRAFEADPMLQPVLKDTSRAPGTAFPVVHTDLRRAGKPDMVIVEGPLQGNIVDITSKGKQASKLEKYHDRTIVLTYDDAPKAAGHTKKRK